MRRASFAWSPVSDSKNSRVPDFAMVPMFCTTSSRDIPTPLSDTVSVCAALSNEMRILRAGSDSYSALSASASKRSLSAASAALEMSSRRKISLLLYKEWIIRCRSCFTSAWKPSVSFTVIDSVISVQCLYFRMADPLTGSCLCGALRYTVTAPVAELRAYHCTHCQKSSGAGGTVNAVLASDAFRITQGTPKRYAARADSGRTLFQFFAATAARPYTASAKPIPAWWWCARAPWTMPVTCGSPRTSGRTAPGRGRTSTRRRSSIPDNPRRGHGQGLSRRNLSLDQGPREVVRLRQACRPGDTE